MLNTPLYKRESGFRRMLRLLSGELLAPFALMLAVLAFSLTTLSASKVSVVKKEPLVTSISAAVGNGADISVIRHIYKQRKQERSSLGSVLFTRTQDAFRSDEYYSAETPLSDILQDIRASQFTTKGQDGLSQRAQLEKLIREHAQTNPFDKLESGQRETFDNVRAKLGANYDVIQNDLTRIGDELYGKNIAVEKYLRDSTFNLWLSVFALFMSLVISSYQIFQSRENRLVNLFRRVVNSKQDPASAADAEA